MTILNPCEISTLIKTYLHGTNKELIMILTKHTSINSLFAPSEIAARLSYCSGSNSFKAAVRYSPAGVVFFSESDLTKATVPSVFSAANGEVVTSIVRLLLSFLFKINKRVAQPYNQIRLKKKKKEKRREREEKEEDGKQLNQHLITNILPPKVPRLHIY